MKGEIRIAGFEGFTGPGFPLPKEDTCGSLRNVDIKDNGDRFSPEVEEMLNQILLQQLMPAAVEPEDVIHKSALDIVAEEMGLPIKDETGPSNINGNRPDFFGESFFG